MGSAARAVAVAAAAAEPATTTTSASTVAAWSTSATGVGSGGGGILGGAGGKAYPSLGSSSSAWTLASTTSCGSGGVGSGGGGGGGGGSGSGTDRPYSGQAADAPATRRSKRWNRDKQMTGRQRRATAAAVAAPAGVSPPQADKPTIPARASLPALPLSSIAAGGTTAAVLRGVATAPTSPLVLSDANSPRLCPGHPFPPPTPPPVPEDTATSAVDVVRSVGEWPLRDPTAVVHDHVRATRDRAVYPKAVVESRVAAGGVVASLLAAAGVTSGDWGDATTDGRASDADDGGGDASSSVGAGVGGEEAISRRRASAADQRGGNSDASSSLSSSFGGLPAAVEADTAAVAANPSAALTIAAVGDWTPECGMPPAPPSPPLPPPVLPSLPPPPPPPPPPLTPTVAAGEEGAPAGGAAGAPEPSVMEVAAATVASSGRCSVSTVVAEFWYLRIRNPLKP
ncbi:hypothetical protein MMPV_004942 [Pyropia vietnamensis]